MNIFHPQAASANPSITIRIRRDENEDSSRCAGRPVMPIHAPAHTAMQESAASTAPIGCIYMLAMKLPRTNHAKLVVIPQAGHGMPTLCKKPHSAIPRLRCVPRPVALGVSDTATIRTAKQANEIAAAKNRSDIDSHPVGPRVT